MRLDDLRGRHTARADRPSRWWRRRWARHAGKAAAAVAAATTLLIAPLTPALAADDTVRPGQTFPGDPAGTGPYTADWDSLADHTPSPDWFKDAKFGVYWHWGAFSVPAYASEWYGRYMYENGDVRNHHQQTFGDQFDTSGTGFGYDKFITGGLDKNGNPVQFAPKLSRDGGRFDPAAWAALIKESGAQFAGPVAEHHDGFSMWDSQVNEWNSVDLGPNLDLMKVFGEEIRKQDLKYMVAMHHAYNMNGFFDQAPTQPTDSLKKLYGQLPKETENQLWYDKLREVVDQAQPDMIWQDFGLDMKGIPEASVCTGGVCSVDEQQRLNFLSYYFNKGHEWGKDVVSTFKHFDKGFTNKESVEDYERGGPGDIVYPYWLTDDSVSTSSWSYTNGMGYYSSTQMIHSLMDRVSKNGNLLLNIAPQSDGSIPQGQQDILRDIGHYLQRNGEAVYSTRAWDVYGEGPTKAGGGSFTAPLTGTAQDVRYTVSKDDKKLYATILGWPGDGAKVSLKTLGGSSVDLSGLADVKLFGANAGDRIDLEWMQNAGALQVTLPSSAPVQEQAYVVELSFPNGVPVVNGDQRVGLYASADGSGSGVSVPLGDQQGRILTERGLSGSDIASLRVGSDVKVLAYSSDDLSGEPVVYRSDSGGVITPTAPIGSIRVESDASPISYLTANANGLRWDTNGSTTSGSPVVQKTAEANDNQKWQFVPTSDGYVRLVNPATGLAITSPSGDQGVGVTMTTVVGEDAAQEWKPTPVGSSWVFVNRANGSLALDSGGGVPSGSPLKQWTNNGSGNLQFTSADAATTAFTGEYEVTAEANGLAWDTNGSSSTGTDVVQKTPARSSAQEWTFQATDAGYYRIVNPATGRAIESVTTQEGATTKLTNVSDAVGQQWKPVARGSSWVFQSRADNAIVLDSGGSVASGSPLKQWRDNGSGNFRFLLTAAEPQATVTIDTASERAYGTEGTVAVTVTGTKEVPAGRVTLASGDSRLGGPVTLAKGKATFTLPGDALSVGTHTLRVSYDAESPYTDVIATARVTITGTEPTPTPTVTPEPTSTPTPTASPEPTSTPTPTASPEPTSTPTPTASPEPTSTPTPTASPEPTATPTPTASPEPTTSPTTVPTAPAGAPSESALTEALRGGITAPDSAVAGSTITVSAGAARAGQTLSGWLFSSPTPLGSATADALGAVRFTVPASMTAGMHRLAVTDANGAVIGWEPIEIRRPEAAGLAQTGSQVALGALALGGALVSAGIWMVSRRRTGSV